jgi:hypothetical protein
MNQRLTAEVDEELYAGLRERAFAEDLPLADVVLAALRAALRAPLTPRKHLRVVALRRKIRLVDKPYPPPDDDRRAELVAGLHGVGVLAAALLDDDREDVPA